MLMLLFAVVEIGSDTSALLLLAAVFITVFLLVGLVAYWLLVRIRHDQQGTISWQFSSTRRLPVSQETSERIVRAATAAVSRPPMTPERRELLRGLHETRRTLSGFYRRMMLLIGLAGVGVSTILFLQATSANMLGLPAALILLFSLAALGNALIPNRSILPFESRDEGLLDKIDVQVVRRPLTVRLGEFEMIKAADLLRRGSSPEEALRAVYPQYHELDDMERTALQLALRQALESERKREP